MSGGGTIARADGAPESAVLMFDGECGLCRRVVRWLLAKDRRRRLRYAPLQGRCAQALLRAHGLPTEDFDSLVFVRAWQEGAEDGPPMRLGALPILLRTVGALAAVGLLDAPWRWLVCLRVVPRTLRDGAYRVVARVRHRLFGDWRTVSLPETGGDARRFLP